MPLPAGTRLGPYEVLALLGMGGMGEVYRARDTRLDRVVAIKILPPDLAGTPEIRTRFEREARAISSLNHPHICTLHDVGHQDGLHYLVMEYLEGETLAIRLRRGPLPPSELSRHAIAIAEALDAAHRSGLVHRDLKPSNIMLTRSGAKLLDFGLAREIGTGPEGSTQTESPTRSQPLTAEGTILGTFPYMAPEQLEGKEADARTDIWALGCVLYEMSTGKKAFQGTSRASLIAAIMERDPTALTTSAPPQFDRIVRRCLAKDPEARWQTARDLAHEIRSIHEDSSSRSRRAFEAGAILVVMLASAFLAARLLRPGPPRLNPKMTVRGLQLPFESISYPGLSLDGKWIVFAAANDGGLWSVYVLNARGGEPREITKPSIDPIGSVDISPDGGTVVYEVSLSGHQTLFTVPILGGAIRRLVDIGWEPHWRPDGERIGYQVPSYGNRSGKLELWSVKHDGSGRRLEYRDSLYAGTGSFSFSWSPDGKRVAWLRGFENDAYVELVVRGLATGEERQLTHDRKSIDEVWWTRQNEIVFSSNRGGSTNLWMIRASGGPPVQVTKGSGADIGMRVSADGQTLLCLQTQSRSHLWIGDLEKGISRRVTDENLGLPDLSPDHRRIAVPVWDVDPLVTTSNIYVMNRDGTGRRKITPEGLSAVNVAWSPDGNWIAYDDRHGVTTADSIRIYVADANDPENTRRIGFGRDPSWLDDTTLCVTGRTRSWQITLRDSGRRAVSPDSIYELLLDGKNWLEIDLHRRREGQYFRPRGSTPGDPSTRRFLLPITTRSSSWRPAFGFNRARNLIVYVDESGRLFGIHPEDGRRVPIDGNFNGLTPQSTGKLTPDGREIVYLEPAYSARLVLIENLR